MRFNTARFQYLAILSLFIIALVAFTGRVAIASDPGTVVATISVGVGSGPYGIATNATNNRVYVANNGHINVSVIDISPSAPTSTPTTTSDLAPSSSGGDEPARWRPWPTPTPNPSTGEGFANPTVGGSMTSRDARVSVNVPGGAVNGTPDSSRSGVDFGIRYRAP